MDHQDAIELNRRAWDERVPLHLASDFYDVAGFKAGHPVMQALEIDELGPLGGLHMAHLQCHFGLDTLDLVRLHPDLTAVGLDFSAPAVAAANQLAADIGLDDRARFVHADLYQAAATLGAEVFDLVYTGKGALCWLPDLRLWAEQVAAILKPGGTLYLCEFHPISETLGIEEPTVVDDYFRTEPWVDEVSGSYAAPAADTEANVNVCWQHPLAEVFDALLGTGFTVRFFHEFDHTLFERHKYMVKGAFGRWEWPSPSARVPMMYTLKAIRQ